MDELVESVYDIDNEELVEYRGNYSDFPRSLFNFTLGIDRANARLKE